MKNVLLRSARLYPVVCASLLALAACSSSSPGATSGAGGSGTGTGGTASGGSGPGSGGVTGGGATGSGGATVNDAAADGPVPALNPVATHGQLKVVGTQLQDQAGHPVQLKGASSQWLNYETKTFPESEPALQYARDHWKLSVIRAAMGVDAQGGYLGTGTGTNANKAGMLAKVNTIIQNAIDLGIYVIVDWHTSAAVTSKGTTQTTEASDFFTQIATQYGTSPNVIYETYNEPTGVTWAQIKPYHEAVVAAIRAVDSDNLIVLGTPNWSQDVDLAAADPVAGTNLLYTLHFYACTHKQSLRDKADRAIALALPLFVTEFGATPSDGGVTRSGDNYVCEGETNTWFGWMAQNNISGASWKLDQCTDRAASLPPTRRSTAPGPTTTSPATPPVRPSTAAKRAAATASSSSTGCGSSGRRPAAARARIV